MLLVTGGAGFIGSNLVASLNEAGRTDVVVNDVLGPGSKWRNLQKRQIADLIHPGDLLRWLDGRSLEAVVHLGAISETTATDGDAVVASNLRLSIDILDWCTRTGTPFIYASSAATYGDGQRGFIDDWSLEALRELRPMNLYGWSKHAFDIAITERARRKEKLPPQWVGLKFFNVFGANEYHKGTMASVLAQVYDRAAQGEPVRLFRSYREGVADGDQRRDFISVDDAVGVTRWMIRQQGVSGIFNVGTGAARSFRDLVSAMFAALGQAPRLEYVEMPETIRATYQYFTQADVTNLRAAGYTAKFAPLEDAVYDYVTRFLSQPDRYR